MQNSASQRSLPPPPPMAAVDDETLREQFSRLTDRFALPLANTEGATHHSSGESGSLSARGGLSTSNSASLSHSTSIAESPCPVIGGAVFKGLAHPVHTQHEAAPPSSPQHRRHHRPPNGVFAADTAPGPQHAHGPPYRLDTTPRAVLLFERRNAPSPATGDTLAEATTGDRRRRHARPASAPMLSASLAPPANDTRHTPREAAGGRSGGRTELPFSPFQRPSRPMRAASSTGAAQRRPSLRTTPSSTRASSRASTPRELATGAGVGGRGPRQRPASAQPALSHRAGQSSAPASPPPPPSSNAATLSSHHTHHPGHVYVRRLVRPKLARSGLSPSPGCATASSGPPTSPTTMRAHLSRPALVARRVVLEAAASRNGGGAPRATCPPTPAPNTPPAGPSTAEGDAGDVPSARPGSAAPPLRHGAPVPAPLAPADIETALEEAEGSHGGHARVKHSPSLSSPSGGFIGLAPHAPTSTHAGSGGGRHHSMQRLSRSNSSCHPVTRPQACDDRSSTAGQGRRERADSRAVAPAMNAFVPLAAAVAADGPSPPSTPFQSRSSSPEAIPSPSTLAQRLRERGNDSFRAGNYTEAAALYSEGLQLQPSNELVACNRAAAYLMSFRYGAALVDCKWVLLHAPKNLSAHWRAAKSFLYTNRIAEARRFYRTAHQLSEEDHITLSGSYRRDSTGSRGASLASVHASGGHSGNVKWLKDRRSISAEEAALSDVEVYWQQMRQGDWPAAVDTVTRVMNVFGGDGPTATIWHARRLEALLHVDARQAMDQVRALRQLYPDCLDLLFVEAKTLFHCAHDNNSTSQCLALLDELHTRAAAMNEELHRNVTHYSRYQYRNSPPAANLGCGAAARTAPPENDVSDWAQLYQWKEDSRLVQLQRSIELFARYRDDGNRAYLKSDWTAAHNAYTRCLQVDPTNRSLMSTTYCNRSAVAMQSGRWKDALADAHAAIELNPLHTKAVSRRARIYLHLFQQQEERTQRSPPPHSGGREWVRTAREAMLRYLDAAVEDCKTASTLAPQDPKLQQDLREAMQCRHGFLQQQQQWQQQQRSGPFSSHAQAASADPSTSGGGGGHSYARYRRAPRFFTGDENSQDDDGEPEPWSRRRSGDEQGGKHHARRPTAAADSRAVLLRYLEVLELPVSAYASGKVEPRALSKAYREAALRWHPDKWVSGTAQEKAHAEVRFKEVTVAYTALKECAG